MPTYTKGELAWCSFMNKVDKFEYLWSGYKKQRPEIRIHPTQKPVKLYEWILKNYAKENDKILDTHLGSGSIAIAIDSVNKIEKMNLTLTACELDKEYYDKSVERIEAATAQTTIFD